ncbi:MAG: lectin like domain-containing protein, partial [Actinomycetes bacterium]
MAPSVSFRRASGLAILGLVLATAIALAVTGSAFAADSPQSIRPQIISGAIPVESAPLSREFAAWRIESLSPLSTLQVGQVTGASGQRPVGRVPSPLSLRLNAAGVGAQAALPASYDLRPNRVTAVRDQGEENTCWTHAAYGSLESYLRPGESADFSEAHMVLASGFGPAGQTTKQLYDNGGGFEWGAAYLARWAGPVNQGEQPYGSTNNLVPGLTAKKHVQDVTWLPQRTPPTDVAADTAIKTAVQTTGGVAVSMYMDEVTYFNDASDAYYYNGSGDINHDVVIVGWNDTYSKTNFLAGKQPAGNGAWIARNSWGTSFGDSGYFYVSYYDTRFAQQTVNMAFDNADATTNYGSVLQYDTLGQTGQIGGSTTGWFMNKFPVASASILKAVGFYAMGPGTTYEVYAGVDGSTLPLVATGTFTNAGYHTVVLPNWVGVSAASKLDVAVKVTTPGESNPIAVEQRITNWSDQAVASAGQGYYSLNGTSWSDLTALSGHSNSSVCLKAFVNPGYTLTYSAGTGGSIVGTATQVVPSGGSGTEVEA